MHIKSKKTNVKNKKEVTQNTLSRKTEVGGKVTERLVSKVLVKRSNTNI